MDVMLCPAIRLKPTRLAHIRKKAYSATYKHVKKDFPEVPVRIDVNRLITYLAQ
jgi:hypothetical protein